MYRVEFFLELIKRRGLLPSRTRPTKQIMNPSRCEIKAMQILSDNINGCCKQQEGGNTMERKAT